MRSTYSRYLLLTYLCNTRFYPLFKLVLEIYTIVEDTCNFIYVRYICKMPCFPQFINVA